MIDSLCVPAGRLRHWSDKKYPILVIGLLTFLVVLPFYFHRGFLFLLDWLAVPRIAFPSNFTNDILFRLGYWAASLVVPADILQKVFLSSIIFLLGWGSYRAVLDLFPRQEPWGAYFAAFFFMFNPFVYSRLIVGQWPIVFAMALVPWFFSLLASLPARPWISNALRLALWWTLIIGISPHVGTALIIPVVVSLLSGVLFFEIGRMLQYAKILVVGVGIFIILNLYWIIPTILPNSALNHFVNSSITTVDIFAFSTRPDSHYGVLANATGLYGFWADSDQRYAPEKFFVHGWIILLAILLGIVMVGFVALIRTDGAETALQESVEDIARRRWLAITMVLTAIIAFVLGIGVSEPVSQPFILWLYRTIPFYQGFRESQKFFFLLVFTYALLGAVGVNVIISWFECQQSQPLQKTLLVIPGLLLLLPVVYSPGLFWGFHRQLQPHEYPQSWYVADAFLERDPDSFRVVFFPWHQYIQLSFADTVSINPADAFFHKPVLRGDNVELGPIYSQSVRPESTVIQDQILAQKATIHDAGRRLAGIDVKYILLTKDSDSFSYGFLDHQKDLQLVFQNADFKIYRNTVWQTVDK